MDFCFRGDNYITKKVRVVSPACYRRTSPPPPFIIKFFYLKQYGKYWPLQDFGFKGDNYIMKRVRVLSLARNTPTGLPLHSYQILLKYV